MNFSQAVEALYHLKPQVIGSGADRHERPHKPVLLLAVFDAIAAGKARPDHIAWTQWLRDRFAVYFDLVRAHNDECTPENPFFYLRSEGFWEPVKLSATGESPLESTPLVRDADTGRVFARFTPDWRLLVANPQFRAGLRDALVSRYFPQTRAMLQPHFIEPLASLGPAAELVAEESAEVALPARKAAFRREVLEIYDYQCAACGLRIWLPEHQLTFVDAAHIVPWSESWNDHPTNGLALCKNHHWAFDQRVIAPDADAVWRVSRHLEPRRSRGEEDLTRLAGQRLLGPAEPAFLPKREHLEWRFQRLLN